MPAPVVLAALSPVEMAAVTVPLALFLLLTETAVGSYVTTEALRFRGGLTPGFLKFMAATCAILAGLGLLVCLAAPVTAYHDVLTLNRGSATLLPAISALATASFVAVSIAAFRGATAGWLRLFALLVVAAELVDLAVTFAPLGSTWWGAATVGATIMLSTAVLGTATTGMLLGHWYLVTPALTNRPLLRSITWLLVALAGQAVAFLIALAGLPQGAGSPAPPLLQNPILAILWALGAVALPLLAAGLALPACRLRSFMSATGLLYLAMIAIFPGELVGQLLLFTAAR
ncbi:MAG TPA: hypothetical protein VET65_03715 [Candidatus Limnocylindrales bacterium]|nr:hypothetical protein [Candidatus Limnocylindrales bacterium]